MRSFEERKEEIFRRSQQRIAQRKKAVRRTFLTCVPLVLCLSVVGGYLALSGFGRADQSAPESNKSAAGLMDVRAPEAAMEPEAASPMAPPADTTACLELIRQGESYVYTEDAYIDRFAQILIVPETESENADPEEEDAMSQHSTAESCTVILTHADGWQERFTLAGKRLIAEDGTVYVLTDQQSRWLYDLMA